MHVVLAPGTTLGRYTIEALVGQGGMGAVYRAYDAKLDRPVALKSMRTDLREDASSMARFAREAQVLGQLNHPGICQVYDWVEQDGRTYMAMEWIDGVSLSARMKMAEGPIPPSEAMAILRTIASALEAAHAKGIVHRDLKPQNVMLAADGNVKVLDFGLAKRTGTEDLSEQFTTGSTPILALPPEGSDTLLAHPGSHAGNTHGSASRLTEVGTIMGSPGYMSPEQILSTGVGPASDVFSLGICAHEMLSGHAPFEGQGLDLFRAVADHRRVAPPVRPGPKRLWMLVEGMLEPNPSQRPSASEILLQLDLLLHPPTTWKWALASAGAALLLCGGVYLALDRGVAADLLGDRPARVLVLPVLNQTGDARLEALATTGFPELLGRGLQGSRRLAAVDPEEAGKAIRDLKLDPRKDSQALAKVAGAVLTLEGTLRNEGAETVYRFVLKDSGGRVRHAGELRQPQREELLAQTFTGPAAESLRKAVDPLGKTGVKEEPLSPRAMEAYAEGRARAIRGQHREAEPFFKEAAYAAPRCSWMVGQYASTLRQVSSDQAWPVTHWALATARASGDRRAAVLALHAQALLCEAEGRTAQQEEILNLALAQTRDLQDADLECRILQDLGRVARWRGDDALAQRHFETVFRRLPETGNPLLEIHALINLGNQALNRNELPEAERYYQRARDRAQAQGHLAAEGLGENNLGVIRVVQFRLDEAKVHLQKSLELRRRAGNRTSEANTLRNLGTVARMQGRLEESRDLQEQSLVVAQDANLAAPEARALACLGELDRIQGRWTQAIAHFKAAEALFRAQEQRTELAATLGGMAECLALQPHPQLARAESLAREATDLDPKHPAALKARAWIHHLRGRKAEALQDLEDALADPQHRAPELREEILALQAKMR